MATIKSGVNTDFESYLGDNWHAIRCLKWLILNNFHISFWRMLPHCAEPLWHDWHGMWHAPLTI